MAQRVEQRHARVKRHAVVTAVDIQAGGNHRRSYLFRPEWAYSEANCASCDDGCADKLPSRQVAVIVAHDLTSEERVKGRRRANQVPSVNSAEYGVQLSNLC